MYRNVIYNQNDGQIVLKTWDSDGNRVDYTNSFRPYYLMETQRKECYAKSIFGSSLKRVEFENNFERSKSLKEGLLTEVYHNFPPEQQFLIDTFYRHNKKPEFSQHPLKIFYLDIEVYSPYEFPDEWEAKHPINVITIYDSLCDEYTIFGLKNDYNENELSQENRDRLKSIKARGSVFTYIQCRHEKELLGQLIRYWKKDYPDVLTGWNLPFDMPYIINRINSILGPKYAKMLSPCGYIRKYNKRKKIQAQFTINVEDYEIKGISTLDYQDVYSKFNIKPVPNKKLDTIAEIELDENKVEYESSNLAKLADDDWNLFVFYNIIDVDIIRRLEDKLKFLSIARMLAYMGLAPLHKALDTLPIVSGYAAINALEEEKYIPTFQKQNKDWPKYEGAYVHDPIKGFHEMIVSYDLNSLYPNTMITLNASPETKFGKVRKLSETRYQVITSSKEYILTEEKLKNFLRDNNIAMSRSGVLFLQNKKGILPKLVEEVYIGRVDDKAKIKQNKQQLEKERDPATIRELKKENDQLDILQYAKKILINSVYGYCGNKYAAMSDLDIAESITLTCQDVIKQSGTITTNILNKIIKEDNPIDDYLIYNDTDSEYITLKKVVDKLKIPFLGRDGLVHPNVIKIVNKIEDSLNAGIKKWGETELNSCDSRFQFKAEIIADHGIFIAKKKYALHKLYDEGFGVTDPEKRWKYTGLVLVSAQIPKELKPLIKDVLHDMILHKDERSASKIYYDAFEKYKQLPIDSVALVKAVNKFSEYSNQCKGVTVFAPRMNAHYKGAHVYNYLLNELNISHKYEKIRDADKVKWFYVKPHNKYNVEAIAYLDKFPKEFEPIFEIDQIKMFEKSVKDVIQKFYDAVGWVVQSPNKQTKVNVLMEFLES